MTNYPRWTDSSQVGSFSNPSSDGSTVTCAIGQTSYASISAAAGKFVFGVKANGQYSQNAGLRCAEFFLTGGANSAIFAGQDLTLTKYNNGSVSSYSMSGTWASIIYVCYHVDSGLVWLTLGDGNFWGASGTALSAAQVAADTDGINWAGFTGVSDGAGAYGYSGSTAGAWTLLTGAAGFPFTLPSGYGPLPATVSIFSFGLFNVGDALPINWLGAAQSGLNGSLDGGTFSTLSGTTSGSGGTALGPAVSDLDIHYAQLQDATYPLDVTFPGYFQACPSGPPLLSNADVASSSSTETLALTSNANTLSFAINSNVLAHDGTFGEGDTFVFANSAGGTLLPVSIIYPDTGGGVDGTLTVGSFTPVVLTSGANGQVTGNMTLGVSGSNVVGTLAFTANGTLQSSSSYTFATGTTSDLVSQVLVTPVLTLNGRTLRGVSISGSAPAGTAQLPWRSPLQTLHGLFHEEVPFAGRSSKRVLKGTSTTPPPVLPLRPGRLAQTIAAHFAPEPFAGRQRARVAIGPVPPPPVLGKPFSRVAQALRTYAAHFTAPPYPGQRQPRWWPMNYGGGVNLPARASQVAAEALVTDAAPVRASQTVVEALMRDAAPVRASQAVVEALYQQSNPTYVRASQIVVEVLVPLLEMPLPPVYPILIGLTFDYVKRNKQSVGRGVASSGREIAVNYWTYPQWEWDLNYDILADTGQNVGTTASDIKTLLGFVLNMQGSYSPFFFQDPDDNAVTGQALGAGDGTTTTFTFIRTYGQDSALGDFLGTEPIGGLNMNKAINIYIGGVQQESGYTIDNSTPYGNTVAFTTPPAVDAVITADFSFYYFCRIKEDTLEMKKFMYQLWAVDRVTIFSLKN
jgi:uncharacterized protein (TIGR02217 family)